MTSPYSVHTTPHFDRSLKKLSRRHPHLADRYAEAIDILRADPQNLIRAHNIRKLEGPSQVRGSTGSGSGDGDSATTFLAVRRLFQCNLRREETYR